MWPRKIAMFMRGTGGIKNEPIVTLGPAMSPQESFEKIRKLIQDDSVPLKKIMNADSHSNVRKNKRDFMQRAVVAMIQSGGAVSADIMANSAEAIYNAIERKVDEA